MDQTDAKGDIETLRSAFWPIAEVRGGTTEQPLVATRRHWLTEYREVIDGLVAAQLALLS